MMTYINGVAAKGEQSGHYRVKRKRGTDYCTEDPCCPVKRGGTEGTTDWYMSNAQIQEYGLEICGEYDTTFVDRCIWPDRLP